MHLVTKLNRSIRASLLLLGWTGFFISLPAVQAQDQALAEQSHHARELMASGQFEQAIPIYKHLVAAVPGNPGLILNLGLAQQMAGHPQQAIPQFQAVLKLEPGNIPALTSLAMSHLQLRQPAPAVAPLRKLVTLQPDNRDARGMLAGALMGTDQPEEAAAQYRKLGAADSYDAKAWYGLGSAYEASANNTFNHLTKMAIDSPYWAALVAESQLQRSQFSSSFYFYRLAEKGMPKLRGIHAGLAQVYRKTNHEDWAKLEDQQESGLSNQPCPAKSAECYFLNGKLLDAAQAPATQPESLFWKTKALNALALEAFSHLGGLPESPELHAIKAGIMRTHGQFKEAADEWRAAIKLSPADPGLRRELITTLFLSHDYESLQPMLQASLKNDPNSPELNFMLGDTLLRTQQPNKAVPYLEAALKEESTMLPAHASLGFALSQTNHAADAIPHFEKALEIDDDGSIHYQLARAYQTTGNTAKSKDLMAQYQAITAKSQSAKEEVAKEAQITAPEAK